MATEQDKEIIRRMAGALQLYLSHSCPTDLVIRHPWLHHSDYGHLDGVHHGRCTVNTGTEPAKPAGRRYGTGA